jgi:hypothetical protein
MVLDIPSDDYKSASDPSIPFFSFKEVIGTSVITHDTLNEFGLLCKTVVITNFDTVNNIAVTTKDPANPTDQIPPSTKGSQDEWISFVKITPNVGTGKGILELQLVTRENAKDPMKLAMKIKSFMDSGMNKNQIMEQINIEKTWA